MKFLGNCRVLVSSEGRGEWNFVAAAKVKRPATRSGNISKRWNGEEIVNYTLYYLGKRRHRLEQTSIKISDLRRGGIRIIMAGYKWNRRDKSRVIIYYYFSIFPPPSNEMLCSTMIDKNGWSFLWGERRPKIMFGCRQFAVKWVSQCRNALCY